MNTTRKDLEKIDSKIEALEQQKEKLVQELHEELVAQGERDRNRWLAMMARCEGLLDRLNAFLGKVESDG